MRLTRKAGLLDSTKTYIWKAYVCTAVSKGFSDGIEFSSGAVFGDAAVSISDGRFYLFNTSSAPQATQTNFNKYTFDGTDGTFKTIYKIKDFFEYNGYKGSYNYIIYTLTETSPQTFSDASPDTYPENGYTTVNGTGYWFVRQN